VPFDWWPVFRASGYQLPPEAYEAALRRPGTGGCADGIRGHDEPASRNMTVCFRADDWAQRSISALHEMFHGFQFAYLLWDECMQTNLWFLEGTPDIAGLTASTGALGTHVWVPESGSVQTMEHVLPPRSARWFVIDFSILDQGDGAIGLEVRFEVDAVDATNLNVKYYRDDDIPGWETCSGPLWESTGLVSGRSARLTRPGHERPERPVYALVANTHHADSATVRLEVTTAAAPAP